MRSIINGVHRCTWLNFVAVHGCLSCAWSVFGSVILNQWCVSTVPRSETAVPYTHSTGAVFCHSNLGLQILRFTTNSASILHSLISATHPTYWIMFYSVFKEIGWHRKTMSQCWWTVVFKRFCTLMNWTWEKKKYNAHLHTTSTTDVTPFSSLQYYQQHKFKHCVLTTVANATKYEVKFFWILGMKEMCVTFLNVKKSKQKPSGDV